MNKPTIQSNSAVSEGWEVKCKCGITYDDGETMVECGGACKTWVHIKCHNIDPKADWYCDSCIEAVQTSKARPEVDHPMDEPEDLEGSKGADDDNANLDLGANAPGDEDVVAALLSNKSRAVSNSPAKGCAKIRAASHSPGAAVADEQQERSPAKGSSKKAKKVSIVSMSEPTVVAVDDVGKAITQQKL